MRWRLEAELLAAGDAVAGECWSLLLGLCAEAAGVAGDAAGMPPDDAAQDSARRGCRPEGEASCARELHTSYGELRRRRRRCHDGAAKGVNTDRVQSTEVIR